MESFVKGRNGSPSSLKIATSLLIVLMNIISGNLLHSASIPASMLNGKCDHFIQDNKVGVSCTSYARIPINIANSARVWFLQMEHGNKIDIVTNGSLIRSNLKALQILNLNRCGIRVVEPGAFSGSDLLIHIYLGRNLITVLNPDIFKDVPSLTVISMNNNPMNKIEQRKTFPNFTEFIALDLSNCRLDTIPTNVFANLKSIRWLNLTGNYLKRLDWRVLQGKSNLTRLNLENNPWHCDCHGKFLMETLKNMNLKKVFDNITCASAEMPIWKGHSWKQVPESDMICHPEINKLVYSSWLSKLNEHDAGERDIVAENETLYLGNDVYFKCEYSGFPKPEVQWFKDNQIIMDNWNKSKSSSNKLARIQPKLKFMNDTSSTLQRLEKDEDIFRYEFRDILAVHQLQVKDQGSYTCAVIRNHVATHKTVTLPEIKILRKAEGNANSIIWKRITYFGLLLLLVLIAAIVVIVRIKRSRREERGTVQESGIDLGNFVVKPSKQDLISVLEDPTDSSII